MSRVQFGINRETGLYAATPEGQFGGTWAVVERKGLLYTFMSDEETSSIFNATSDPACSYEEELLADRLDVLQARVEQIVNADNTHEWWGEEVSR
jgi:hypothetical protein